MKWNKCGELLQNCKHYVKVTSVIWKIPPTTKYNLNTDGKIIYAFAIPHGEGINNTAEVQAASYGLCWCIQHGY